MRLSTKKCFVFAGLFGVVVNVQAAPKLNPFIGTWEMVDNPSASFQMTKDQMTLSGTEVSYQLKNGLAIFDIASVRQEGDYPHQFACIEKSVLYMYSGKDDLMDRVKKYGCSAGDRTLGGKLGTVNYDVLMFQKRH